MGFCFFNNAAIAARAAQVLPWHMLAFDSPSALTTALCLGLIYSSHTNVHVACELSVHLDAASRLIPASWAAQTFQMGCRLLVLRGS